jgi:catechol 2,3-dioxygenase-like lactoylglutathione lyase family enzyme
MDLKHSAVAIVPCNDLDTSQAFYEQLGFHETSIYPHHGYRILHDAKGASIHLTRVEPGSVIPERNAHGIYFYAEDAEALAAAMGCTIECKPWGLMEFAVSDPSGTLVRIGWPGEGAREQSAAARAPS